MQLALDRGAGRIAGPAQGFADLAGDEAEIQGHRLLRGGGLAGSNLPDDGRDLFADLGGGSLGQLGEVGTTLLGGALGGPP